MFESVEGVPARLDRARRALAVAEKRVGIRGSRPRAGGVIRCPARRVDLYEAMARAMGTYGWAGVVALPDVGWLAAAQHGVDLDRVLYVPRTFGSDVAILTALVDACAVVVAGSTRVEPMSARTLAARAHARGCTVIALGAWPGARERAVEVG
ncbi:hypothetical protein H8R18_03720 [Nanchangia anserum]|uniref:Uncharacterized protein n=1 Tax=Nanchangia anserum TaxID=2692125 RepID=A0A8I0GEL6_9ACTO|nr:hypothetical protein [Nanchangia anserum]MBD3688669.1 hypothetical protein [Nanchangia anserum]QOX82423.1 hypothetical protein H8R18_03720 [Nanchangia anserum]